MKKITHSLVLLALAAPPWALAETLLPAADSAAETPGRHSARPTAGNSVENAALACTMIADSAARLACFDGVYGHQFPPRHALSAPAASRPPKTVDLTASTRSSLDHKSPQLVFAAPEAGTESRPYSPMSLLYDLDKNQEGGVFAVREHHPMYLMPAWYRSSPNRTPYSPTRGTAWNDIHTDQRRIETKMQVSFKTKILEDLFASRADVWFGYTQQSNWQVYNQGERSAPFRNSDYAPELFITQPVKAKLPFGGRLRMVGAGFVHQSNGQSQPLSRSWNRLYALAGAEWGKLSVMPRLWTRIDPKGDKDDNPDITKYMGHGDLKLAYRFNDKHTLSSVLRYHPKHGKGAVQLDYTFPVRGRLKGFVQGFYGYGESLIDYNHKQRAIGFGLMFKDWEGL